MEIAEELVLAGIEWPKKHRDGLPRRDELLSIEIDTLELVRRAVGILYQQSKFLGAGTSILLGSKR